MKAILNSNSGDTKLELLFKCQASYAHESGYESTVRIKGRHWDGDHVFPLSVKMEGIWLRSDDLIKMEHHISSWLKQPIDKIEVDDLSKEFELARLPEQSVLISFGSRADTVSSMNPVVTISFSAGPLKGNHHYITDQTCLEMFAKGLRKQQSNQALQPTRTSRAD